VRAGCGQVIEGMAIIVENFFRPYNGRVVVHCVDFRIARHLSGTRQRSIICRRAMPWMELTISYEFYSLERGIEGDNLPERVP